MYETDEMKTAENIDAAVKLLEKESNGVVVVIDGIEYVLIKRENYSTESQYLTR